jgi:hypothetical protein
LYGEGPCELWGGATSVGLVSGLSTTRLKSYFRLSLREWFTLIVHASFKKRYIGLSYLAYVGLSYKGES